MTYFHKYKIFIWPMIIIALYYLAITCSTYIMPQAYLTLFGHVKLVGLPPAIFLISSAVSAILIGRMLPKIGNKVALFISIAIGALGNYLMLVAGHDAGFLGKSLFFSGVICLGASFSAVMILRIYAASYSAYGKQALAIGIIMFGAGIGGCLGSIIFPVIILQGTAPTIDEYWSICLLISSVSILLVLFVSERKVPLSVDVHEKIGDPISPSTLKHIASNCEKYRKYYFERPIDIRFLMVYAILAQATMISVMSLIGLHMGHGNHFGFAAAGLHFLGMFGLMPFLGIVVDRFGINSICRLGLPVTLVSLLLLLSHGNVLVIAGMFLLGIGWSMSFLSASKYIANQAELKQIKYMSYFDAVSYLITAIAILIAGVLIMTFSFPTFITVMIILTVLIFPLDFFMHRSKKDTSVCL